MNKKPEILLSNKGHDMSSWFQEKSNNALSALSKAYDIINKLESQTNEDYLMFKDLLNYAISDNVKLFAFIHGCEERYNYEDTNLIINYGFDGFEQIKVKYGLISKTEKEIKRLKLDSFVKNLRNYISGDRSNRTLLYELTQHCIDSNNLKQEIISNLDKVSMGEISWDCFRDYACELEQEINRIIDEL